MCRNNLTLFLFAIALHQARAQLASSYLTGAILLPYPVVVIILHPYKDPRMVETLQSPPKNTTTGTEYGPTELINCVYNLWGSGQTSTTELTNLLNATQVNTLPTPGYTYDMLPSTKELFPWTGNGDTVYKPPVYNSKCWNRSIGAFPASCKEGCLGYIDMYNATWFVIGELTCSDSYPTPGQVTSDKPVPPAGNINVVLTNQCGQYSFGPPPGNDSTWMSVATDPWGNRWSLQSSMMLPNATYGWEDIVGDAVFPDGWKIENVTITDNETHVPYLQGEDCWLPVIKDSNGNAWHQFEFSTALNEGLLAEANCPPITLSKPAKAPAPATEEPTKPVVPSASPAVPQVPAPSSSAASMVIYSAVVMAVIFAV